jgi:hypothetical protein
MKLPVHKSAPVTTIIVRPNGKMTAPIILIRPGAFSWYQGAVCVLSDAAHAKAKSIPARTELMNILSRRMLAFATPDREQSSTVSCAV